LQVHLVHLKDTLLDVALEAGNAILDIYSQEDFEEELKADNSPLTKADKIANEIICSALASLSDGYPIISEENKQIPYEVREKYTRYWLVDPLDGTKEFVKRNGEFTVNIALIERNRPILGVVYAPALREMYWAIKNLGSFIVKENVESAMKVNEFKLSETGLRLVCSRSHLNDQTALFLEDFDKPITVSRGSSLKFLLLANNLADLYPRLAPTMEWDTAAAQIVLEEAGGMVVDFESKLPMTYNKENLLNPYFLATGKIV
jgi:3'(2'), 5'-bisphosphate nucleotidase